MLSRAKKSYLAYKAYKSYKAYMPFSSKEKQRRPPENVGRPLHYLENEDYFSSARYLMVRII